MDEKHECQECDYWTREAKKTMRITKTDAYIGDAIGDCPVLDDCERAYCSTHRLLYRTCETAQSGYEGDRDIVNGTRQIMDVSGECPKCQRVSEAKKAERLQKEWELRMARTLP